jgi:formate hydrogenlyase transcriptional activator
MTEAVLNSTASAALAAAGGRVHGPQGAAKVLGMNRSTLRSRMEKPGISKEG